MFGALDVDQSWWGQSALSGQLNDFEEEYLGDALRAMNDRGGFPIVDHEGGFGYAAELGELADEEQGAVWTLECRALAEAIHATSCLMATWKCEADGLSIPDEAPDPAELNATIRNAATMLRGAAEVLTAPSRDATSILAAVNTALSVLAAAVPPGPWSIVAWGAAALISSVAGPALANLGAGALDNELATLGNEYARAVQQFADAKLSSFRCICSCQRP